METIDLLDASGNVVTVASPNAILETLRQSLGQNGFAYAADTEPVEGAFIALFALQDAVFSELRTSSTDSDLSGLSLTTGLTIYGQFSGFTLTSGKVIAYNA